MPRPSTRTSLPLLAALAATALGCATRGDVELLEARLRAREDELATVYSQLSSTRNELEVAHRDGEQLRAQLAGVPAILPEQADALYRAKSLRILGMLTAGVDEDDRPGDESFTAVVAPHDADGALVKLPGRLEVEIREPTPDGTGTTIGRWEFTSEESRRLWQHDLLGGGFRLRLPWQRGPRSERLVLSATLHTADGRRFEATHDFRVKPPSEVQPAAAEADPDTKPKTDVEPSTEPPAMRQPRLIPPEPLPPIDGTETPDGDVDRSEPVRSSDRFRVDEIPRYN